MFDNFEPFQELEFFDFLFHSQRQEVHRNGNMIDFGVSFISMELKTKIINGIEKGIIYISDNDLDRYLTLMCEFDIIMTSNDRVQLFILPEFHNIENNLGFKLFIDNFGSTRDVKMFERNEPFCCNLFFQNSKIIKVTFNIPQPETLIEFYIN